MSPDLSDNTPKGQSGPERYAVGSHHPQCVETWGRGQRRGGYSSPQVFL